MSRSRTGSPRAVAAAAVLAAVLSGCAGPAGTASPARNPRYPALCASAVAEVRALWDPARAGAAGYGDVPTLAAPPSLYLTSWSLRLAAALRTRAPGIDQPLLVHWLVKDLRGTGGTSVTGLDRITQIYLAASALARLGSPHPAAVATAVAALRRHGRYASSPKAAASWSSTYLAVSSLALSGNQVPAGVLSALEAGLTAVPAAAKLPEVFSAALPIIASLAQVPAGRQAAGRLPGLRQELAAWWSAITRLAPAGPGVGYLATIAQTMRALRMPALPLPAGYLSQLSLPSGYLTVFQGSHDGDPQVTYDALLLGATPAAATATTLLTGLARQGWISPISSPGAPSTYQATVINSACGRLPHRRQLRPLITSWLTAASEAAPRTSRAQAGTGGIAQLCWLATRYGISLTASQARWARGTILASITPSATRSPATIAALTADAASCHVQLPASQRKKLLSAAEHSHASTSIAAFSLAVTARHLRSRHLLTRARADLAPLRTHGAYTYQQETGSSPAQPDLLSTYYGTLVDGPHAVHSISQVFMTPWGPQLSAPTAGNHTPQVDLSSLAVGILLESGQWPTVPFL